MMATTAALKHPEIDLSAIYRLSDHLDATLAMGEDLLAQAIKVAQPVTGDANAQIADRQNALADYARTVRALELGMTARILQARVRAKDVRNTHPEFAPLVGLFIGGTAPLADAVAGIDGGLGDVSALALTSGPDVLVFLKTRGLVDSQMRSLAGLTSLAASEGYLLGERIHLGTLMDMIAAFLEGLDLAFDVYGAPAAPLTE